MAALAIVVLLPAALIAAAVTSRPVAAAVTATGRPALAAATVEELEARIAELEQELAALREAQGSFGADMVADYLRYLRDEGDAYRRALEDDRDTFIGLVHWVIGIFGILVGFAVGIGTFLFGRSWREIRGNLAAQESKLREKAEAQLAERTRELWGEATQRVVEAVAAVVRNLNDEEVVALRSAVSRELNLRRSTVLLIAASEAGLDDLADEAEHLQGLGLGVRCVVFDEAGLDAALSGVQMVVYRYVKGPSPDPCLAALAAKLKGLQQPKPMPLIVYSRDKVEGEDQTALGVHKRHTFANTTQALMTRVYSTLLIEAAREEPPGATVA